MAWSIIRWVILACRSSVATIGNLVAQPIANLHEEIALGIVLAVRQHRAMQREENAVEFACQRDVLQQPGLELRIAGDAEWTTRYRAGRDQRHDIRPGSEADAERASHFGSGIGEIEEVGALQQIAVLEVRQLGAPGDEGVAFLGDLADADARAAFDLFDTHGWWF